MLLLSLLLMAGIQAFASDSVPFTLHNKTLKSIPLVIPNVMNPNLSPISDSGVDLAVGQKIYFIHKHKRYLLIEVTPVYANTVVDVAEVIEQRKKELNLN